MKKWTPVRVACSAANGRCENEPETLSEGTSSLDRVE